MELSFQEISCSVAGHSLGGCRRYILHSSLQRRILVSGTPRNSPKDEGDDSNFVTSGNHFISIPVIRRYVRSLYFFSDNPGSQTTVENRKQNCERYRTGKVRYRDVRYLPGPFKDMVVLLFVVPTRKKGAAAAPAVDHRDVTRKENGSSDPPSSNDSNGRV